MTNPGAEPSKTAGEALRTARADHAVARGRRGTVDALVASLLELREQNHFAERMERAFRESRR